jgi:hypothetical protein
MASHLLGVWSILISLRGTHNWILEPEDSCRREINADEPSFARQFSTLTGGPLS